MKTINVLNIGMFGILLVLLLTAGFTEGRSQTNDCLHNNIVNDFCIVSQIDSIIKNEPYLRNISVYAASKHGHVALLGTVNTKSQAEKIIAAVKSINGVKKVDITNVQIKSHKTPLIDIQILSTIDKKMKDDVLLNHTKIYAISKRGYVSLAGLVDTKLEAERIVTLVNSIKGVRGIDITNLQVKND